MKSIKFDFYTVETPQGAPTFATILNRVRAMADDEGRNVHHQGTAIRLSENDEWQHGVEGDLVRIRLDDLPVKASLSGDIEPFQLEDDEGVGDQSAFFFHPETSVLVLQRNRHGVSDSAFCYYFENVVALQAPIYLNPVIHPDALLRMRRIRDVRKFVVRVAGITNATFLTRTDVGLNEIPRIMSEFESPSLEIEMSMGHLRGGMNRNRIFSACRELFRVSRSTKAVRKLEITGGTIDDDKLMLDLIEDRLTATRDVRPGTDRVLDFESRRRALRSVWHEAEREVRAILGDLAGEPQD